MKKLFTTTLLISLSICISSCEIIKQTDKERVSSQSGELTVDSSINTKIEKEQQTQEIIQNKIDTIRKRLALKGLIIQGDSHYRDGELTLALTKYLEFYRKNPLDSVILEKLGDTYFDLHKYTSALNYYKKIQDPNSGIIEKISLCLILETDFSSPESKNKTKNSLRAYVENPDTIYYYLTSVSCSEDFHECKKDFGAHFWPEISQQSEKTEETGENQIENEVQHEKLLSLKSAIQNYRNFQVDEVYLKDAFIIGSWYESGLYSLSAHMGEKLLSYKPGYKPILKIVAQSYFKMGEYKIARDILSKYSDTDTTDPGVNYMLGVINTQLREYVLANIYLSKAIELGYTPSIDLRKQLIHNFYKLENEIGIMSEFKELVENEVSYTAQDLGLAIYYNILGGDYELAQEWVQLGKEKFPDNAENFYAYDGWIKRELGNYEGAQETLLIGRKQYGDHPFIMINLGYTSLALENTVNAVLYFKKVLITSPESEFALQAQNELDIISQK